MTDTEWLIHQCERHGIAVRDQGAAKAGRLSEQFFVINKPGSNLAEGIWRKRGNRIDPVVLFVSQPHYSKRFDFFGVAEKIGRRLLPAKLEETIEWILDHPHR